MQINLYVLLNQDHNKTYHIKNEKELGSHFKLLEILHFMAELFFFQQKQIQLINAKTTSHKLIDETELHQTVFGENIC